jgi:hypothetical protein
VINLDGFDVHTLDVVGAIFGERENETCLFVEILI